MCVYIYVYIYIYKSIYIYLDALYKLIAANSYLVYYFIIVAYNYIYIGRETDIGIDIDLGI